MKKVRVEQAAMIVPIVAVAVLAFVRRWTFDDGFIYFRTVDQLLAGNGPVFNDGERVESFTSPAWLGVLTFGNLVSPLRLEYTAVVLSIASTVGGLALAVTASARISLLHPGSGPPGFRVPLGLVVFASLWPVWIWGTSGMEVGLTFCWLGGCFFVLTGWAADSVRGAMKSATTISVRHLALLGLGPLVRPELLISSLAFVGVVATMTTTSRWLRLKMIGIAAVVPVAYQVFRMGYYGMIVSSPAVAKEGARTRVSQGWSYLVDFVGPYLLVLPLFLVVAFAGIPLVRRFVAVREPRVIAAVLVVSVSGIAHAAYVVAVGGDYVHARLLLPALFAFLAPVFVVSTTRSSLGAIAMVCGWVPVAALFLRPSHSNETGRISVGYFGRSLTYEDRGFERRGEQPWMDGPGLYIAFPFEAGGFRTSISLADPAEIAVASPAIGVNGYVLGPEITVIDLYGLADPLVGHQEAVQGRLPGHEKPAYEPWLIARFAADPDEASPSELVLENLDMTSPLPYLYLESIAWAQDALHCDPVARLDNSVEAPLTLGRFTSNLWNATQNTLLRIDRDPRDAYRALCGRGLSPNVVELHNRHRRVESLPLQSERADVAVIDDCRFVFFGTANAEEPWEPIHVSGYRLLVSFEAEDSRARFVQLFALGPYGDATATVGIETDGDGRYRVRQDIEWFPPRLQEWTRIPSSAEIELTLGVDFSEQTWSTTADGEEVSALPLLTPPSDLYHAVEPRFADADQYSPIGVEVEASPPSPLCRRALDGSE